MNRIITSFLAVAALAAFACAAFAVDPDYTYRESNRTQIMSNIYSVAVTFPGNATIATNLIAGGAAAIQGAANVNGNLTVSTNFIKMMPAGNLEVANAFTNVGVSVLRGAVTLHGATTATNVTTLSVNARKVICGKDNTSTFVVESGSCTGTEVVTYTTPFSANPVVFLTGGTTAFATGNAMTNLFPVMTNPRTNFTTTALGTETINWLAIGSK